MVLNTKQKRHPAASARKGRTSPRHKKDGHYLKTYWPYLPMVAIVVVGMLFSNLWGFAQSHVLGYATSTSVSGLLSGTNDQRAANSLGALALNDQLNQAAQNKANDMVNRNYWSHNTPDGSPPWVFITDAGYQYSTAGENLAYGFDSSDATITGWMNSPGHRANILNTSYKEVGFGIANSPDYQGTGPETIVVAMYASKAEPAPAPAATQPSQPAATQPTPTQQAPEPKPETSTQPEQQATDKPKETNAVASAGAKPVDSKTVTTQNVSRIQLLTQGQAPWSMFAVTLIAAVSAAVFFLRHGLFWHRALVKGEAFIMHHKLLDVALVAAGVLGFILTRSAGIIR